jgi:(p)ppGpp synthase/HD superfamily hydrolase
MDPAAVLPECDFLAPEVGVDELASRLLAAAGDPIVGAALDVAAAAHVRHVRDEGAPYLVHPLRVALSLQELHPDPSVVAAALCHDVLEDAPDYAGAVRELGPAVTRLVRVVTDGWDDDYYERITSAGADAARLKMADRIDNVRFLHRTAAHKHARYVRATRRDFPAVAVAAASARLEAALWALVGWQESCAPEALW